MQKFTPQTRIGGLRLKRYVERVKPTNIGNGTKLAYSTKNITI